jgi:hypothetical protein
MALGSEAVLLQALNPACGLSQVLKTQEPYCRMVGAQVELLSVEVLIEMFSVLTIASSSQWVTQ